MASYNYNELWKKYNKLKYYRLKNNYTQQYVADFLKITQQNYQKYESGSLQPSVFLIIKLTELYKTSVEELTGYNVIKKKLIFLPAGAPCPGNYKRECEVMKNDRRGYLC